MRDTEIDRIEVVEVCPTQPPLIEEGREKLTLVVHVDQDPMSPRDWDNLGTIYHWHGRYDLGTRIQPWSAENDHHRLCDLNNKARTTTLTEDEAIELADLLNTRPFQSEDVYLPVYMYDHSGVTIRTLPFSCPWDSGQVGWVVASEEAIRKEYSVQEITPEIRTKVEDVLRCEVETYSRYLEGAVYGFVLEDAQGEHKDSCWGFIGHLESVLPGMLAQAGVQRADEEEEEEEEDDK